MQTYGTITLTVPVFCEDRMDFEDLRDRLSEVLRKELPKTTLYDWIKNVCLLREDKIYSSTYNTEEFGTLLEWLTFRNHYRSSKKAVSEYKQHLRRKYQEEQNGFNGCTEKSA